MLCRNFTVLQSVAQAARREAAKKRALTQFGRAMGELSVGIIAANSPQAKGHVERVNRTLQGRLLKELALEKTPLGVGIKEIGAANAFLEKTFLKSFNREFFKTPASGTNAHHKVPAHVQLEDVLCHKESRVVGEDWCVRYEGRILQIQKQPESLALAGVRIDVLQRSDGTLKLMHGAANLTFEEVASRPQKMPVKKVKPAPQTPWRPGPDHPWKKTPACRDRAAQADG